MKRLLIILGISLSIISCKEADVKVLDNKLNSLYQDKTTDDEDAQPKSIPFIFMSNEHKLVGRILMAVNNDPKATLIFLHGNPGFEKNEDVGQALRRGNYNTVFFSYSGTWGNEGVFNYSNAIDDVNAIVKYLKTNSKALKIDKEKIYLCGFSMGADIAILAAQTNPSIKGVISIDPWNGFSTLSHKTELELDRYAKNVDQRPCIKVKSGQAFVASILEHKTMDLTTTLLDYPKPIIHIFSNEKDKNTFVEQLGSAKNECRVIPASDHSFSDQRIGLTNEIAAWLNQSKTK